MEPELTPEGIRSHYRHLTASHFERALQIPGLASQLLAIFSRLSDNQIMQAVPYMSTEQISKAIPRLELQQTGVAMRVMSPTQVRITMSSLLDEDRSLLSENITLLSSSTTKEELQSLLGFIDPLVIACAAQSDGGIADRLIETANSLTSEQIRIMMPMLNCSQIRRVFLIIEDDARFDVAFEMLDKKGEVIELLSKELPQVQEKLNVLRFEVVTTEKILNRLQSELNSKQSSDRQHTREIREVQTGIETLQRSVREIQTQHRLMGRLASQKEFESECLSKLEQDLTDLSSSVRSLHLLLCHETDGLIHRFNTTKSRLIVNDSPSSSPSRSHSNSPVASPPSSPVSKVRPRDRHNGQSQEVVNPFLSILMINTKFYSFDLLLFNV
eukprot:TRINITY_DN2705_c0_g1_i1.p1 TRINITY_DN2705_c0_g1~~TRINITY_DN2705_c0_g1_i1.p1  ORF type:complete len:399 (+),score=82.88 TRINITY_DN2705_c0_g1_i1:45-1199(+)